MKITIDIEDLVNHFVEDADCGEYGIESQFDLKDEIKRTIVNQVAMSNFRSEIKEMRSHAITRVSELVKEKISEVIEKQVERIVRTDKFKYNWSTE